MRTLQLDDTKFKLPEKANELTEEQLLYLAKLSTQSLPLADVKLRLLLVILNAQIVRTNPSETNKNTKYILFVNKKTFPLTAEQFTTITNTLDFLFVPTDVENQMAICPDITEQKFPKIQVGCVMEKTNCGDYFENMTYEQFLLIQNYITQPNPAKYILAILYGTVPQSTAEMNEKIKRTEKVSENVKIITMWYVQACSKFITKKFKRVFSGSQNKNSRSQNTYDLQQQIIDTLADNDVTKKPEIRSANLFDVLYTLDMAIQNTEAKTTKK